MIEPGSLRRAMRGHRNFALVLRRLTYEEQVKYAYTTSNRDEPAWMTLHLETGEQVPHGEDALQRETSWSNEDL